MSYTITVSVLRTNPGSSFLRLVELASWQGSTWVEDKDRYVLTMTNSGTCGTLRFMSDDNNEIVTTTFGVHNPARWCDLVRALSPNDTGVVVTPQYYDSKGADRCKARENTLAQYQPKSAQGRQY
ncbi:fungal fruit body lectin [Pterulicium gracile]|uniref:Fungal fruit body lectin n=1 Tax=Pterulicium gracile TaxID=1884261 RepID=A0A5C3QHC9_9AGAR|nr:fungal fruit body lectin [Pterula gracilis]